MPEKRAKSFDPLTAPCKSMVRPCSRLVHTDVAGGRLVVQAVSHHVCSPSAEHEATVTASLAQRDSREGMEQGSHGPPRGRQPLAILSGRAREQHKQWCAALFHLFLIPPCFWLPAAPFLWKPRPSGLQS